MIDHTATSRPVNIDELIGETTPEERVFILQREFVQTVASLVRTMRNRAGFEQKDLAAAAATSQSAISDIERAAGPHGPTAAVLARIAHACGQRLVLTAEPLAASGSRDTMKLSPR
jgi:ribosome-binding protein aMBF1 (putative translation factor)